MAELDGLINSYLAGRDVKRQRDLDLAHQAMANANLALQQQEAAQRQQRFDAEMQDNKAERFTKGITALSPWVQQGFSGEQLQPLFDSYNAAIGTPKEQIPKLTFPESPRIGLGREKTQNQYDAAIKRIQGMQDKAARQFIGNQVKDLMSQGLSQQDALVQALSQHDLLHSILASNQPDFGSATPNPSDTPTPSGMLPQTPAGSSPVVNPFQAPLPSSPLLPQQGQPTAGVNVDMSSALEKIKASPYLGTEPTPLATDRSTNYEYSRLLMKARTEAVKSAEARARELFPVKKASALIARDLTSARIGLVKAQARTQEIINRFSPEQFKVRIEAGAETASRAQAETMRILEAVKTLKSNREIAQRSGSYVTPSGTIAPKPDNPLVLNKQIREGTRSLQEMQRTYSGTIKALGEQAMMLDSLRSKIANGERGVYIFSKDEQSQLPTDPAQLQTFQQNYMTRLRAMAARAQASVNELTDLAHSQKRTTEELHKQVSEIESARGKVNNRILPGGTLKRPVPAQNPQKPAPKKTTLFDNANDLNLFERRAS